MNFIDSELTMITFMVSKLENIKTMTLEQSDDYIFKWNLYNMACTDILEILIDTQTIEQRDQALARALAKIQDIVKELSKPFNTPTGQA